MKQQILESQGEYFAVFFEQDGDMRWSGEVYPIISVQGDVIGYYNEHRSDLEENKEEARCHFHFSYCWRGVWEGRFYPKQEEYWGEDISTLSDLWDQVEKICKEKIVSDNPDYKHFD